MRFLLKRRPVESSSRPALDRGEALWLSGNRRPFDSFSVASLVPAVFERYARILHPASSYGNLPVRWDEVAAWSGRTAHALAQWELLSRPVEGRVLGTRPFVLPPRAGGMPQRELKAVCELLAPHTADADRCFIAIWDGYGAPVPLVSAATAAGDAPQTPKAMSVEIPMPPLWAAASQVRFEYRAFLVTEGSLSTVAEMAGRHGAYGYQLPPTLFWPADHTWFAATDPDLDSTYVGGSALAIESILADDRFEAWPASADDDITIGSDERNS